MFHVIEAARLRTTGAIPSTAADGNNGSFQLESPEPGWQLFLVASQCLGWEHLSVHARRAPSARHTGPQRRRIRTPTWKEMAYVKRLFWDGEDVVIQFHPRESEYINAHEHVLHLWRPTDAVIPTPPPHLVGPPVDGARSLAR